MNKIISLDSLQRLVVNPLKRLIDKKVDKIYVDTVVTEIPRIDKTDKPHQQLVTDANGNAVWENRTHYTEKRQVTLLEEGGFLDNAMELGGYWISMTADVPIYRLNAGDKCVVCIDGVAYNLTAAEYPEFDAQTGDVQGYFLGNASLMSVFGMPAAELLPDTGEQILVRAQYDGDDPYAVMVFTVEKPEVISIDVLEEVKIPLDAGYIPSGISGGATEAVWFNLDYKTMGATCNYTYDQVAQMLDENVSVSIFAHMHTPDGNMRMFCVNIHYITSIKMMFYFSSAVGNMNLCLTWNPDETISVEMIESEA